MLARQHINLLEYATENRALQEGSTRDDKECMMCIAKLPRSALNNNNAKHYLEQLAGLFDAISSCTVNLQRLLADHCCHVEQHSCLFKVDV
jgi:hypothetical protein